MSGTLTLSIAPPQELQSWNIGIYGDNGVIDSHGSNDKTYFNGNNDTGTVYGTGSFLTVNSSSTDYAGWLRGTSDHAEVNSSNMMKG